MTGLPTGSPAPITPAGTAPDVPPVAVVDLADHDPRLDRAALDRSLVRGVAWTGAIKWITQIAAWLSTLAVARLLSPEDYGLVGMAAVYLGLLTMLSEAGLGTTIIAVRDLRGSRLGQMHTLAAIVGVTGFLVSCIVAGPLARFFNAPLLRGVVIALSANFVIMSLRTIPQASLQRQLRFGRVALIDGVNSLVTASTAVILAMAGLRYWALVAAALTGSVFATIVALTSQPVRFERPKPNELQDALRVSRDIIVSSLAWYVFQNADFFVAGKVLGKAALGTYTFAWNLAYSIVDKVTALVTGVTSSIFSAAKHDRALLTRYLTQITGRSRSRCCRRPRASRSLPGSVPDRRGRSGKPAIVPLRLLVLYAGIRSLTPILSQALTITGDTRYTMQRSIVGRDLPARSDSRSARDGGSTASRRRGSSFMRRSSCSRCCDASPASGHRPRATTCRCLRPALVSTADHGGRRARREFGDAARPAAVWPSSSSRSPREALATRAALVPLPRKRDSRSCGCRSNCDLAWSAQRRLGAPRLPERAARSWTTSHASAARLLASPTTHCSRSRAGTEPRDEPVLLSLVIPVYNEEATLDALFATLRDRLAPLGMSYEVVLIDDGSRDRTGEMIAEMTRRDPRFRSVHFSRNFGHQAAVTAGLHFARGSAVVVMDADLQDPPELLASMIARWREGYHVVYAQRVKRHAEGALKRGIAFAVLSAAPAPDGRDIPADTGDFCLMDRRVVDLLNRMPERNRYLRGLRAWLGFRQTAVPFERPPQVRG